MMLLPGAPSGAAHSSRPLQMAGAAHGTAAGGDSVVGEGAGDDMIASDNIAQLLKQQAEKYVAEPPYGQAYDLPPRPPELYRNQTNTLLGVKPQDVAFSVHKLQEVRAANRGDLFQRVLDQLPGDTRDTLQRK